ncbi:MAG TPA: aspartate--tRNA ligase [Acidimicrobiales bacterium]
MTMRTHYCGDVRPEHIGERISVCGWVLARREHGDELAFIDLRDHTGVVQCVVDHAHDLRKEFVLRITGTVRPRPEGTVNPELATGQVELGECDVEILNQSEPPPFPVTDRIEADEHIRLRYRYVDLRRDRMQRNLRIRASVNSAIRSAMESQGFVEVETPMLIASTPEGARDFMVPSRLAPGSAYALPQSPQLFKQLLMVGGFDRYYQIARCLRDEDLRADRQFEFMQLDAEASFVTQDDVFSFIGEAVLAAVEAATGSRPSGDIPVMSWTEAMDRFGSDKPDVRFGMELTDVSAVMAGTDFRAFQAPAVKGIRVPGGAELSRNRLDDLTDRAKGWGAKGLVWMKVESATAVSSPVAKFLTDEEIAGLVAVLDGVEGDLLLLVADDRRVVNHVLGLLRADLGRPAVTEGGVNLLWVVDFPLFEEIADDGRPVPGHHPFTMPHPDDLGLLPSANSEELLAVRSLSYDLVLNGWELGSGSVRIHDPDIQQQIFGLLGIDEAEAQARFGFLLDAFRFGAPPHAGFAFGIDRLVAILAGEENIREVIAFPKTQSGTDPLTGAPTPIGAAELADLGLRMRLA